MEVDCVFDLVGLHDLLSSVCVVSREHAPASLLNALLLGTLQAYLIKRPISCCFNTEFLVVVFQISLPFEPRGKGRPRLARRGRHTVAYTPATTANWEKAAALLIRPKWARKPLDQPIRLIVDAVKTRPKRLYAKKHPDGEMWRPHKPDADNVAKIVMDTLERAGVVTNDIIVCELICRSLYAKRNAGPVVRIRIEMLGERTCGQSQKTA